MSSGEPAQWAPRTLAATAKSLLQSRHLPAAAAVLSVLLALPALGVGWVLDDHYHRTILLERPRLRDLLGPPSEMFRFFRGDPDRTGRLMDLGLFPWWTDPGLKAEFLQALTVLTHRLDYALWPDSPELMHAHSLFWLGAACLPWRASTGGCSARHGLQASRRCYSRWTTRGRNCRFSRPTATFCWPRPSASRP